jgi:hypothetical protein
VPHFYAERHEKRGKNAKKTARNSKMEKLFIPFEYGQETYKAFVGFHAYIKRNARFKKQKKKKSTSVVDKGLARLKVNLQKVTIDITHHTLSCENPLKRTIKQHWLGD